MYFFDNESLFSFKLNGIDSKDLNCKISSTVDNNVTTTVYDYDGGLRITNIFKKYDDFGAYEWVNYYENASNEPTGILSDVFDCDVLVPLENDDKVLNSFWLQSRESCTKVFAPYGSICSPAEFSYDPDAQGLGHLKLGMQFNYYSEGGRSSDNHAPFFNINKENNGYIFAIGWSGQWDSIIDRVEGAVRFRSGVLGANFKVLPGEKFRTASIVILPYHNGLDESQVSWRRLVKTHFCNMGKGDRPSHMPMFATMWGGLPSETVTERINIIKKHELPFDGVWLDAGWYGVDTPPCEEHEGEWSNHTGDWRPSRITHKNGLKDVSKLIHDSNMKFLLWFEPERAIKGTPITLEHPEYFMMLGNSANAVVDLGREDALNYTIDTFSNIIEELGIDVFRIDCNCDPAPYWNVYDEPERKGIKQIKYVNGLYRFWDALLERFPRLIIDNCAGGGRRIDIETLRRSVTFWRSDITCTSNPCPEHMQLHTQSYSTWMPYSGTGTPVQFDEYEFRSTYCGATDVRWFGSFDTFVDFDKMGPTLKKYMDEYLSIRDYFYADYYQLTKNTANRDVWCASQFNRPEENDGILQIFRREFSPYKTCQFVLKGFESGAKYVFEDIDGGEPEIWDADVIMSTGYEITVPNQRSAKIIKYRKV